MKQKPGRDAAALLALPGLSGLSSFRQPLPCPAAGGWLCSALGPGPSRVPDSSESDL